jgi:hypothetical protein
MNEKSILLGLNEINFEFVQKYIDRGLLPNFKRIFSKNGYKTTTSESSYELLEPWIQWVSIHTGKTYEEHKVFRLGDIAERGDLKQLWEVAEAKGHSVGAVSPFNARNNLRNPAFFIPDPWTQTPPSGSQTVIALSNAVSNAVNNNANNKLTTESITSLLKGFVVFVPPARYFHYINLMAKIKRRSTKAAILDNVLADTFFSLWKKHKPQFSSLFLNSGAHVQHHYMFNSKVYDGDQKNPSWYCPADEDPMLDMLVEYDSILGRLMSLNCRLFIATGLHQKAHTKTTFYWRLKNHMDFLKTIGIPSVRSVIPRMSRDFLVESSTNSEAKKIEDILNSIVAVQNGEKIFSVDNRGVSLFIELIYPHDIKGNFKISKNGTEQDLDFSEHVSFVAIKNGEHDGLGYFVDTNQKFSPEQVMPVKEIFQHITNSF